MLGSCYQICSRIVDYFAQTSSQYAGLASVSGTEGLQIAHKWLADLLVYFSKDVTAYSAVRLVSILLQVHVHFINFACAGIT